MTATPSKFRADSLVDTFGAVVPWAVVLEPHGWTCVLGTGDSPRSRWRAPVTTADYSADIRTMQLFLYDSSTNIGRPNSPGSLSKFDVWARLNFDGDHAAATAALREYGLPA